MESADEKKDLMDKAIVLFNLLKSEGVTLPAGQTAIVCNDGVVTVTLNEGKIDLHICTNKIDFPHTLGITDEDVEQFNIVEELIKQI